jgi:hypothetical protein
MWKYNHLKWKSNNLKLIVLLSVVLLVFISHLVVANNKDHVDNDHFGEIWIKLWEKGGRAVDLRVHVSDIGYSFHSEDKTLFLQRYPIQIDVTELGDIAAEDIHGIVSGYEITPAGNPGHPLMFRWWIVKKHLPEPNSPYILTLNLRTWDFEGNEFDPQRQQAILVDKSSILNESSRIRPVM